MNSRFKSTGGKEIEEKCPVRIYVISITYIVMGHYIYWHFPYKQFLPGLTGTSPDSIRRGRNGTYNPMMLLITHSLLSGKELAEEKNLIINGIIPVFSIVFTGTGNKIMIYLAAQQPIVKVFVHIQKKIILTAIYN